MRLASGPFVTTQLIACQPRFSDAFVEFRIRINGDEIECAPRARVEGGGHQEWVELGHRSSLRRRTGFASLRMTTQARMTT